MTDLISREAAIALLNRLESPFNKYSHAPQNCAYCDALDAAIEALTNMPSADTLATNQINALKDALAEAESRIALLEHDAQYPRD